MNPEKIAHTESRKRKRSKNQIESNTKNMTKNRVTMKMGLYTKGKKSDTVTRVVSEEVKARANEDLKRILQLASSPINKRRKNNLVLDRPSTSSVDENCDDGDSEDDPCEDELDRNFSSSPPLRMMSNRISGILEEKICDLFPGIDYLKEHKNNLRQFLAKNHDEPLFLGPQISPPPRELEESEFSLDIPNQKSTQTVSYLDVIEERSPESRPTQNNESKWRDSPISLKHQLQETYYSHKRDKTSSSPITNTDVLDYLEPIEIDDVGEDGSEYESDDATKWKNYLQSSSRKPALFESPSPPQTFYRRKLY